MAESDAGAPEPGDDERVLEIIQLANGDVILQRPSVEGVVATEDDALLRLRFSPEMLDVLGGDLLTVAEAMVEAAADALGEIQDRDEGGDGEDGLALLARRGRGPTLH
ncbi:MAG TPA: hypothetical protein VLA56_06455 [Pseudomonadales bacterium]|nr:hypothetical protein [Pseudomonadales bacterium]